MFTKLDVYLNKAAAESSQLLSIPRIKFRLDVHRVKRDGRNLRSTRENIVTLYPEPGS